LRVAEEAREGVVEIPVPASELADLEASLQTEHDRLRKLGRHLLQHGPAVQDLARIAFSLAAHLERLRQRVAAYRR
jgi:hypothetical protein